MSRRLSLIIPFVLVLSLSEVLAGNGDGRPEILLRLKRGLRFLSGKERSKGIVILNRIVADLEKRIGAAAATADDFFLLGKAHFFFLPPLVPNPSPGGEFDETVTPTVEICQMDGAACGATIATYTMTTGPGSETIRVVPEDEHYIVNWHTDEFGLDV